MQSRMGHTRRRKAEIGFSEQQGRDTLPRPTGADDGDVFQQALPGILRQQNPHVPAPFRHGLSIFTNLTILQSACSAIHKDTPNGKGFACMTTVEGPGRTYSGGTFCFVDFGVTIAVKPGDLLHR